MQIQKQEVNFDEKLVKSPDEEGPVLHVLQTLQN